VTLLPAPWRTLAQGAYRGAQAYHTLIPLYVAGSHVPYSVSYRRRATTGLHAHWFRRAAQEAHVNGLACVIACAQQEAEDYCERLRLNGLMVTLEPSGSGGGGSPDAC